jgi:hypothetical protein
MPGVEHVPITWALDTMVKRAMAPTLVVDHIMQGFLRTIVDWASNGQSKIIVHFGIDRVGRIVQFHPVNQVGRHVSGIISPVSKLVKARGQDAGTTGANGYCIGIEHEGCSVDPMYGGKPFSPASMIYSPTNPWPAAMVDASIAIKVWCFKNVPSLGSPSRDTVIGHYEVDARNRPDDPVSKAQRTAGHAVWPIAHMLSRLSVVPPKEDYVDTAYTVVRPKETLTVIGARTGRTVKQLTDLNNLADPNDLKVNQILRTNDTVPVIPWLDRGGEDVRALLVEVDGWFAQTEARTEVSQDGVRGARQEIARRLAALPGPLP